MTDQLPFEQKLLFTQRYGLAPVPALLSFSDVSKDLWNDLFNTLQIACSKEAEQGNLGQDIWTHFLHEPLGRIPRSDFSYKVSTTMVIEHVRYDWESQQRGYLYCPRHRVYDLVEFVYASQHSDSIREALQTAVNLDLKRDFASVSMIDGLIVPISDDEQRHTLEIAMQGPLPEVYAQLHNALAFLADREKPAYGDSIKNAISAVESLCKRVVKNQKATLGDALKELKKAGVTIHPSLERAFGELYGYTSDKPGIRHALMGSDDTDQEDARYMLVTCSAFINYLMVKAGKVKIRL
ncbi:AbiJ-NTD4 domain-containing protein [Candidatus Cryosericum terrychapinii]|jgi:hypothetical protein|uniref:HEPN AbiJ-N-terminal domain-containing protein n=1 Tax=Candidatus Cryosericum terrychapinii TaxID=2290919 RepID=A0A398D6A0_9BACT|nr:hypothetical protein [Candidatus Cryosericum terrychapinii]RIE06624.1 hypothetical protein SMC7_01035 [Candidatus Cryosericum terrychapinii]